MKRENSLQKKSEWAFKEDWIEDVTEDNDLVYLGAALATEVFEKTKTNTEKKRLKNQVNKINKDLGRLNAEKDDEEKTPGQFAEEVQIEIERKTTSKRGDLAKN